MILALVEAVRNTNNVMEKTPEGRSGLAGHIEQTMLGPDTTQKKVEQLISDSLEMGFAGICIPPFFTGSAGRLLKEAQSDMKLVTVVSFPYGYANITTKAEATKKVISDGADEVDIVMNIGAFLGGNYSQVGDEIESVKTLCNMNNRVLKVIIETGMLSDDQIKIAAELCAEKEVDFVKTSTGINAPGATVEVVRLLRQVLPDQIQIKASGGIRTAEQAKSLLDAGASRIGTSKGFEILGE